jgi:hypothetical protein
MQVKLVAPKAKPAKPFPGPKLASLTGRASHLYNRKMILEYILCSITVDVCSWYSPPFSLFRQESVYVQQYRCSLCPNSFADHRS